MPAHATVTIEEVLGRSKQGVTEPFICRGDDGEIYYVKGFGAGRHSLIAEWVSAHLATAFGLPIAEYALAEVPEQLVAAKVLPEIGDLGPGYVFASRKLANAQELTPTTRDLVPEDLARDILVFDWWVRNEDRHLTSHGGNPNLLWDVASNQLVVIDHNRAFDADFGPEQFLSTHVFADHWNEVFEDFDLRLAYLRRMERALQCLPAARDSIPSEWWWIGEGVPANVSWDVIAAYLDNCHREDFWDLP